MLNLTSSTTLRKEKSLPVGSTWLFLPAGGVGRPHSGKLASKGTRWLPLVPSKRTDERRRRKKNKQPKRQTANNCRPQNGVVYSANTQNGPARCGTGRWHATLSFGERAHRESGGFPGDQPVYLAGVGGCHGSLDGEGRSKGKQAAPPIYRRGLL